MTVEDLAELARLYIRRAARRGRGRGARGGVSLIMLLPKTLNKTKP